jgi:aryl-alcohol dehydrogenase-like predicted oxidoreductase
MKTRILGSTGIEVSAIGVGAMSFTNFYGETSEAESHSVLRAALDRGVTHIDTANVYGGGLSETVIGKFLAQQGRRKNGLFSIATKAGIAVDPNSGRRYFDNSAGYLTAQLDLSLARLGLDYVDLFYVHRRDSETPIEDVTSTLADLVKAGKIRGFGFSEIAPTSLVRAQAIHPVAAVQSEYSLSVRSPELGLVQTTRELGVALVAFSPLGRSLLTDKPHNADRVKQSAWLGTNPRFLPPNLTANIAATASFRALAKDYGLSAAALAIAWLLHKGDHILPIPGTRSVQHFAEHCDGATKTLSPAQIGEIETILPIGWAHGDRYSEAQWVGPERYC